jgi:oligopeptide transport system permease protein
VSLRPARRPLLLPAVSEAPVPTYSYWTRVGQRLLRSRLALIGFAIIGLLIAIAVLAPIVAPYNPSEQNLGIGKQFLDPSLDHWMGTDALGRDWFSRIIYGTRISLAVGLMAQVVVIGVGLPLGLIAGFKGARADSLIMRLTDLSYAFPDLLVVILLRGVVGGNFFMLILTIGLVTWMDVTRLVRGQVLSLREQEFVVAARMLGATDTAIMRQHLLPNLAGPLVVIVALAIPKVVFIEATLSFIGYGVSTSTPSWGAMVQEGYAAFNHPHLMLFPAAAISLLLLAFTFIADGLRDALDPTTDVSRRLPEAQTTPETEETQEPRELPKAV